MPPSKNARPDPANQRTDRHRAIYVLRHLPRTREAQRYARQQAAIAAKRAARG